MLLCHLPSAARPRGNAYQASPESRDPLVTVPLRPPSPPAPRGDRGPGRGAQRPFANQKNRRAQNDLGRRPSMTNLERRLIDDDDGAAPASHYSTIASHRDLRRCHDGGTARPRSPRARPTSSLRERPGRVRSCSSSPLDLTSGGPARGLHAPPGPNGLLRGRHVPHALLPPHRPLTPRVVFLLSPSAHKELQSTRDT